jgi:T5SS/PEP-CTERM-associated repeat protein
LVGGFVGNRVATIADGSGSNGLVTVDGAGSRWTNQSRIVVGARGNGTLNITGGGQVTSSGEQVIGRDTGSSGTVKVAGSGSVWTVSGGAPAIYVGNFGTGVLEVSDGGVVSAAGASLRIGSMGSVKGNGTIIANVVNDGKMAPGKSPGTLQINGNYEQAAGGTLELEIGGTAVGSQHDQLIVGGIATLQGDIVLQINNDFLPRAGDQFNLLNVSGSFSNSANVSFTGVAAGWQFSQAFDPNTDMFVITSLNDALPLIPGDHNQDGKVDAADYVAWRKGIGVAPTPENYNLWRANFGKAAAGGSPSVFPPPPSAFNNTVPEPSAAMMCVICLTLLLRRRAPRNS